jgi:hypothetical protein
MSSASKNVRTIAIVRARFKIGMMNLGYNIRRLPHAGGCRAHLRDEIADLGFPASARAPRPTRPLASVETEDLTRRPDIKAFIFAVASDGQTIST